MSIASLLAWNELTGEYYGSEDQSVFFYSLVKMQCPERVLELGTGLGHTSLWIAYALKENNCGHIWTVDNGARWSDVVRDFRRRGPMKTATLRSFPCFAEIVDKYFLNNSRTADAANCHDYFECMDELAAVLEVSPFISFLEGTLSLTDAAAIDSKKYPFMDTVIQRPIDLLYADFDHYPHAILAMLAQYLPLMSEYSSIFVDSASTHLPSYLALEHTIEQLNRGKMPTIFVAGTNRVQRERLAEIIATRRFIHLALPERKDRNQNGLTWIKIEPVNIVPYPLTQMRGFFAGTVSRDSLQSFFERGFLPEEQVASSFLFEQFVRAAYSLSQEELQFLIALIAGRRSN